MCENVVILKRKRTPNLNSDLKSCSDWSIPEISSDLTFELRGSYPDRRQVFTLMNLPRYSGHENTGTYGSRRSEHCSRGF